MVGRCIVARERAERFYLEPQAKSIEIKLEKASALKLPKPASSDILPPIRIHLSNLPNSTTSLGSSLQKHASMGDTLIEPTTFLLYPKFQALTASVCFSTLSVRIIFNKILFVIILRKKLSSQNTLP